MRRARNPRESHVNSSDDTSRACTRPEERREKGVVRASSRRSGVQRSRLCRASGAQESTAFRRAGASGRDATGGESSRRARSGEEKATDVEWNTRSHAESLVVLFLSSPCRPENATRLERGEQPPRANPYAGNFSGGLKFYAGERNLITTADHRSNYPAINLSRATRVTWILLLSPGVVGRFLGVAERPRMQLVTGIMEITPDISSWLFVLSCRYGSSLCFEVR